MNKPTDEQIKEFWEWCGCQVVSFSHFLDGSVVYDLVFTDKAEARYYKTLIDSIDLNNLFKYAVPKLECLTIEVGEGETSVRIIKIPHVYYGVDKDPALALFWAIWKIIKE